MQRTGFKSRLVEFNQVFRVFGVVLKSFLVEIVRSVVILEVFGLAPLVKVGFSLWTSRR
jgi:hypothetical protein